MSDHAEDELNGDRHGVDRIEAFSDGVIAIIITIMVLELHPPLAAGWDHLIGLWPVFLAYSISYMYVAIYWVNHHRLFSFAKGVTNSLIWSNILLLFALSLVPFATSYLGEHHSERNPTLVYLIILLIPATAYRWVQATIERTGTRSDKAISYYRRTRRKGITATLIYVAGIGLALISPYIGLACATLVAALYILPIGPLDRLFD